MNHRISSSGILAVALLGCQNPEYTEPEEANTGTPPRAAGTVYEFHAATAPTYLGASLEHSNAVTAAFVNTEAGITTMPVNGLQPDFAGAEANLLGGVGFGTYANPDYRMPVTWDTAGDFKSVVTAEIAFTSPGDSVLICRSFATTCVELIHNYLPGINIAIVRLAANIPDTEIGEIAPGVSAAVRGTGPNGLTIALTDEDVVAMPFAAAAGTPFTLEWTIARGATEGSLDWSVGITTSAGTATSSGNTAADMATSIAKTGGVGLIFDTPIGDDGTWPPYAIDYYYNFDGAQNGSFDDFGPTDIDLSPQYGLAFAPLYVYPTVDPANRFATFSGFEGTPHAVQHEDGVMGAILAPPGSSSQTFVYSVEFNGDDFDVTAGADPLEGIVDWGIVGGGFYPSPAFAYSQTLLGVQAKVAAGVRRGFHQILFAQMGTGVTSADASFDNVPSAGLVAAINANFGTQLGTTLTYTDLNVTDLSDAIAIATHFADSTIDTAITTSAGDTFEPALTLAAATTFRTELSAIVDALLTPVTPGPAPVYTQLGLDFNSQVVPLVMLDTFLNDFPGVMDGVVDGAGNPIYDTTDPFPSGPCGGFDCLVALITFNIATGHNYGGTNPSGVGIPGLAVPTLWGVGPSPAVDATAAVLVPDTNFTNDFPAYPAVPAAPATPPVREVAAASMNGLVMGVYGNFQSAVFGPGVPASNFSLAMGAGDPAAASGPLLMSLVITDGTAAPAE